MKAIKILGPRKARVSAKVSKPDLPDDCVMIKTMAVSINPTDWKHIDFISTKGATAGCDYSGVVEELGASVDGNLIKVGDRVAGYTHGCNGENLSDGSFAEYIAAKAHINFRLPDSMSFEEGCTLAVGLTTVGQGLYQNLKLPLPSPPHADPDTAVGGRTETNGKQQYILIYGGSTATGTLAIQFAKMSGFTVITTCSLHNFSLVRERGADHVFDYHEADCAAAIRALTSDSLALAFDCITTSESIAICCDALSSRPEVSGKSYCGVFTVGKLPRADVRSGFAMAYTALGNSFQKWDNYYPESREDAVFAGDFLRLCSALLAEGRVIAHPTRICQGGLKGVLEGMDLMRKGKVTGVKLVYPLIQVG